MTRRDTKRKKFINSRDFQVDMRRSRISRNDDTRRLNQCIRSVYARRMMNFDADIRDCAR